MYIYICICGFLRIGCSWLSLGCSHPDFFPPMIGYFVLASEDVPKCSETCGTSGGQTLSQDCPKMAAAENKAASGTLLDG